MKLIFLFTIFLASCSIKDRFSENHSNLITNESSFKDIDSDKNGFISQNEFINNKNKKKLINPNVDHYNPFLITFAIILLVLTLCSLNYIFDQIKFFYLFIINKIKK